jgi:hypothetical protein
VTDTANHRVSLFDLKGNYISSFGKGGSSFLAPRSVAIVQQDYLLVNDAGHNSIQVFVKKDLHYLGCFGTNKSGDDLELKSVSDIRDVGNKQVCLVDSSLACIKVLELIFAQSQS